MTTTLGFKDIITKPQWVPLAPIQVAYSGGPPFVSDLRNNIDCDPIHYYLAAATTLVGYHVKNDNWMFLINPSMQNTPMTGACGVFCPSQGPNGTLAAGATTTSVVINTALPAAAGINTLANRGDSQGYKIRIIGNAAGSSGKTEERYIVGNTAGTQPTITLDSALTFTPAAGDRYEILSGRVYFFVSNSAGGWKYYDVACNVMSGNLSVTNLAAIGTEGNIISLDELHVPYTRAPGEGYFGNLVATATAAATITGQAAGGDAAVLTNEYRNFQIRIVTDTATPTAAGQRRNITSHTAGASPIYTVPAWSVQPSATATYVIENNTDRILMLIGGQQSIYTYNVAANTWDTTTFVARGVSQGAGMMAVHPFGITLDTAKNMRYSQILSFRGGSTNTLDMFDIAAGTGTGAWTLDMARRPTVSFLTTSSWSSQTVVAGFCSVYCPATEEGRYLYISASNAPQYVYRFDVKNRVIEPWAYVPYSATTAVGNLNGQRLTSAVFVDGTTKLSFINMIYGQSATLLVWQCAITR